MTVLFDSGIRVTLDNVTTFADYEYRKMTIKSVSHEYCCESPMRVLLTQLIAFITVLLCIIIHKYALMIYVESLVKIHTELRMYLYTEYRGVHGVRKCIRLYAEYMLMMICMTLSHLNHTHAFAAPLPFI